MRKRFGDKNVIYAAGSSLTGQPLSPIPAKFLKDKSGEQGLSAEYFTGTDLRGKPADTRTDLGVDFSWQKGINSEMSENFSVRWTGTLNPSETGDYQIGFTGTDAFHIWLEDQLIGESQYSDTSKTRLKTVHLEAGHAYPVKVDGRYVMDPSPTPKFDNPKMDDCAALQLFGAGREKRIYAIPPHTRVVSLDFEDHPFEPSRTQETCALCGATDTYLDEVITDDKGGLVYWIRPSDSARLPR